MGVATFLIVNSLLLASEAGVVFDVCTRVYDHRPLPHPPTETRLVGAHFIPFLSFILAYRYTALPHCHADNLVRDPLVGLWDVCPLTVL